MPAAPAENEHHGRRARGRLFWPEHCLIVETDGAATHLTRRAFEDDRRRDAALTILGYRVVRFARRQVAADPRATIATLVLLLAGAA